MATRCGSCGAELAPADTFCGNCGTPRPRLPARFEEAARQFAALKARYEAGELSETDYDAALEKLVIQDEAGAYWMIGTETGQWYRYDGQRWVQAEPALATAAVERPAARPAPPPGVAPSVTGARPPWAWIAAGLGGLLIIATLIAGVLVLPRLLSLVGPTTPVVLRVTATPVPPTRAPAVIVVTATPPPGAPTEPPPPARAVLHQDDFSEQRDPIITDVGEVRWQDGELRLLATKANQTCVAGFQYLVDDFHLEVVARPIQVYPNSLYGVQFRLDPAAPKVSGYWFRIDGNNTCQLCKRLSDQTLKCLTDWQPCAANSKGENRIEIEAVGTALSATVNGKSVFKLSDNTYSKGIIGLAAGNGENTTGTVVSFDDLVITKP